MLKEIHSLLLSGSLEMIGANGHARRRDQNHARFAIRRRNFQRRCISGIRYFVRESNFVVARAKCKRDRILSFAQFDWRLHHWHSRRSMLLSGAAWLSLEVLPENCRRRENTPPVALSHCAQGTAPLRSAWIRWAERLQGAKERE